MAATLTRRFGAKIGAKDKAGLTAFQHATGENNGDVMAVLVRPRPGRVINTFRLH
jgi:hypothetical protein